MVPKRIDSIVTIEDLQMYACSKVRNTKDWAMKCVDCGKCPVGKKAEELLEKETAPKATQQSESGNGRKSGLEKGPQFKRDKTRQNVIDIFEGKKTFDEAMLSFLSKNDPDKKITSIFSKLYDWRTKYPDLAEKYPLMLDMARYLTRKESRYLTVAELLKRFTPANEDEVSVEDFLDEQDPEQLTPMEKFRRGLTMTPGELITAQNEGAIMNPVEALGPIAIETATDDDSQLTQEETTLRDVFSKKRRELRQTFCDISNSIEALKKRQVEVKAQLDSLDSVALMFGMTPTINCKMD